MNNNTILQRALSYYNKEFSSFITLLTFVISIYKIEKINY